MLTIFIPCLTHVCWNMLELLELFYVLNPNAVFNQWKYGGFSHPYYESMFPSDDIYTVLGKGYPFLLGWFIAGCRATSKGKHGKLSPWGPRPLYLRWLKQFEYRWNTPANRCEKALIWKSRVLGASLQLDMRPFLDCMCSGHGRLLQLRVPSGNQTWQWQWTIAHNCLFFWMIFPATKFHKIPWLEGIFQHFPATFDWGSSLPVFQSSPRFIRCSRCYSCVVALATNIEAMGGLLSAADEPQTTGTTVDCNLFSLPVSHVLTIFNLWELQKW